MVKVRFYGALKQFGTAFELEADTPAECIRALIMQIPGLREFIQKGLFTVRIGKQYIDNRYLEKGFFYRLKKGMVVHFTPVLKGAKKAGVFQTILGAVITVIGVVMLYTPAAGFAPNVIGVGIAMMAGGVIQMLTKQPTMQNPNDAEKKQSTAFSNRANMTAQGRMVPLAYGRIRTGSMVISQGVRTIDVDVWKNTSRKVGFGKGRFA
ncbi:putative phage tail protein [Pasteurella langaaensis DSM 22999]|uniref:Putative phage tail protein n=1 Tax=Alitibacter langaaensis DSM 22999 TaxID=1122935 RepID=A0A2U0TAA4_9PAST|nr:tail assembly protein [Pasteurella langaaensis]PVX40519.1 putative phage tail protein [Pasteurella langaaensis DSM 22999]